MSSAQSRLNQQQRSRLLAIILSPFVWLHALTVKPVVNFWLYTVLGAVEESISSLIREGLALTQRSVNGFSAWVLSVFNRDYKQQLRGRWQEVADKHSWWRDEPQKKSTLNAVLARSYAGNEGHLPSDAAPEVAVQLRDSKGSDRKQLHPQSQADTEASAQHSRDTSASVTTYEDAVAPEQSVAQQMRKQKQQQLCEIEAASDQEPEQAQHSSQHSEQDDDSDAASARSTGDDDSSSQWWPTVTPAWITEVSDQAQEAAAAAQERAAAAAAQASAAVQQAASSVSTAVEEAASAAAALARNMRTVFEPQAGWGASEAIRRTGLLEDVSLFSQLLVNRIFDAIRWLIGSLTLVSTGTTPTAQQTANKATSSWFARPPAAATPTFRSSSHTSSTAAAVGAGVAVAGVAAARTARGVAAAAAAGGNGSATAGGLWAAVKRVMWPWGAAATAGAVTAGAAAAAAKDLWEESHKYDLGDKTTAAAGSAAPARVYRRSATSVDLVRSAKLWQSDSEPDDSDTDLTTETEQTDSDQLSVSLTKHVSSTQLPGSSSLRSSASGTDRSRATAVVTGVGAKVAFAAAPKGYNQPAQQPAEGALDHSAAAVDGSSGSSSSMTATPFASVHVQEKHHSAISRQEWKQQKRHKVPRSADNRKQQRRHKGNQQQQQFSQWSSGGSAGSSSGSKGPLYRTRSGPALSELKDVSSAGQVIRMAGYPLEVHQVVTPDGYLLTMERIPQPKSVDVVFMMHGVLDTSLTWVSGGVTGSQAFAAWDRGFDVWLGSSRSNPPHAAVDPKRRGSSYWLYTNNECGVFDMGVQIDHIHAMKVKELAALGISGDAARLNVGSPPPPPAAVAAAAGYGAVDGEHSNAGKQQQQQQQQQQQVEVQEVMQEGQQQHAPPAAEPAVAASPVVLSRSAPPDLLHGSSSTPATTTGDGINSSSRGAAPTRLHHAVSAAEADAAAAAEAAAALIRHRAAVAAAGISADRAIPGTAGGSSSNRSSSEGLASWWPGISSITNFAGFNISLGGLSKKPRSQRLSRRTGSLDLGVAAAAAAAAAAPAAELGAGAAGVLGITAAAAVATAAATSHALQTKDNLQSAKLQAQLDSDSADRSSSSGSSGSSDGMGVSCRIEVPQSGEPVSVNLTPAPTEQEELAAAAAAAAGVACGGTSAEAAAVPSVGRKLSSSSSLRHVLSAPDISTLQFPLPAAAVARSDADSHKSPADGSSSSSTGETATAAMSPAIQQQQQQGHTEADQPSQQQQTSTSSSSAADAANNNSSSSLTGDPYNLRVVAHSLGGFLLLIYCTQRAREGRPHHVKRMVLLSPAGFHTVIPTMFKPVLPTWKVIMYYMAWVWRQKAFPVHLPTFVARLLAFKVAVDTSKLPAVGDLVKAFARLVLGGDRSAWDRALVMPHYAAAGMPLLSSLQVMHFCQLAMTRRCQLYDYGSVAANVAAYQQPTPPNVSDLYHTLQDVPVHLVAGLYDGVIPPTNIKCHYEAMRAAGVDVSYREFEYGHMDFTFSAKEELGYYINSLLTRQ